MLYIMYGLVCWYVFKVFSGFVQSPKWSLKTSMKTKSVTYGEAANYICSPKIGVLPNSCCTLILAETWGKIQQLY